MHRDNWDDLRFVLTVADTGSVSAAARRLGVNHATVLRRVAAFEERHGIIVFERTPSGYHLPAERERLIEAAREAEAAHLAVSRLVAGAREPLAGAIRVTSTDTFCLTILPQALVRLRREAPDLRVELVCSNAHADLSRIEAELAVRPAVQLPEDLVGEKVADVGFAAYAAAGGAPPQWLGLGGALSRSRAAAWLAEAVAPAEIAVAADSFVILREMAAAGLGRVVLPCVLADGDTRLVRLHRAMPHLLVPLWVASHSDLAGAPRIAALRALLSRVIQSDGERLRGG